MREFMGGGLNCEAKAQVFVVTPLPPPLFFLEVGHKMGGVTAGQYGTGPVFMWCNV